MPVPFIISGSLVPSELYSQKICPAQPQPTSPLSFPTHSHPPILLTVYPPHTTYTHLCSNILPPSQRKRMTLYIKPCCFMPQCLCSCCFLCQEQPPQLSPSHAQILSLNVGSSKKLSLMPLLLQVWLGLPPSVVTSSGYPEVLPLVIIAGFLLSLPLQLQFQEGRKHSLAISGPRVPGPGTQEQCHTSLLNCVEGQVAEGSGIAGRCYLETASP